MTAQIFFTGNPPGCSCALVSSAKIVHDNVLEHQHTPCFGPTEANYAMWTCKLMSKWPNGHCYVETELDLESMV